VKSSVIERLLSVVRADVQIVLFTRWRPEEVAAGVSDTSVLGLIEDRGGAVYLLDVLHAKFYRTEKSTLLGSANLTNTALGWAARPNLEILAAGLPGDVAAVERRLSRESTRATAEIAAAVQAAAAQLPCRDSLEDIATHDDEGVRDGPWSPELRQPADLFTAYRDGASRLSSASATAARRDLSVLDLPLGLRRNQVYSLIASRLLQHNLIKDVDDYLLRPRRFGEVRDFLASKLELEQEEADRVWQTLMRWLFEFLPDRYERPPSKWSEVLSRR
jgi:hypothetical protein